MTDQFASYDAAYLLGALTPADRAAFESHLAECTDCRRAVNQLAGLPGLLASVSESNVKSLDEPQPEVPDTLLPRLMHEVQRTRFRRRLTTGLVGVAAAAVLVVAIVFGLRGTSADSTPQAAEHHPMLQMDSLVPGLPIRASARLDDKNWGTKIVVRCVYVDHHLPGGGYEGDEPPTYVMVVTDDSGASQQIAAWEAHPGAPIVVDGSTSVPMSRITSVQIRTTTDQPVLSLDL